MQRAAAAAAVSGFSWNECKNSEKCSHEENLRRDEGERYYLLYFIGLYSFCGSRDKLVYFNYKFCARWLPILYVPVILIWANLYKYYDWTFLSRTTMHHLKVEEKREWVKKQSLLDSVSSFRQFICWVAMKRIRKLVSKIERDESDWTVGTFSQTE